MKKGILAVLALAAAVGIMFACTACSRRAGDMAANDGNVNQLNGNTKGAREDETTVNGVMDENGDVNSNGIEDASEYSTGTAAESMGEKVSDAGDAIKDKAEDVKDGVKNDVKDGTAENETRQREVG